MKGRSLNQKHSRRNGKTASSETKINAEIISVDSTTQLNRSLLPAHLTNYQDILAQLIKRKAHYLNSLENNSSYEEWSKTKESQAMAEAPSRSLEDVLKTRMRLTREQFISNLNWRTLDIINYLISTHSNDLQLTTSADSSHRDILPVNPLVFSATVKRKSKAALSDSLTGRARKGHDRKSTSKSIRLMSTPQLSRSPPELPIYPKKYKPTYKLSNYDYVKLGWTKIPDHSITYKCYTLGSEPAFPEYWAFRTRIDGKKHFYPDTNQLSADFEGDLPYLLYHPNGDVAISINEGRVGPRLIVFSMSKKDSSGRWIDSKPQAMFDSKGNGVVYDLDGKMKMNYGQTEGALYSYGSKPRPVLHWYWKESTYLRMRKDDLQNVPPDHNDDIYQYKSDGDVPKSKSSKKTSKKKSRKNMSAKRKSKTPKSKKKGKKSSKSKKSRKSDSSGKSKKGRKPIEKAKYHKTGTQSTRRSPTSKMWKPKGRRETAGSGIKKRGTRVDVPLLRKKPRNLKPITDFAPLAIKITDHVSMRIMSQQHIHIDFECGTAHFRFYVGVNVKPEIVERIDKVLNPKRVDNVTPCYFELMPMRSMSLYNMNKMVHEMRKEAARREYKRAIRSTEGFYAWWLKKKKLGFDRKQNQRYLEPLMRNKNPSGT